MDVNNDGFFENEPVCKDCNGTGQQIQVERILGVNPYSFVVIALIPPHHSAHGTS